jgi:HEAT repeat protein
VRGLTDANQLNAIALALAEFAKGMKAIAFYPAGHPSLSRVVSRIIAGFRDVAIPKEGLAIEVTRGALLVGEIPLPALSRTVSDLNRELFLRRAGRIIILPGLTGSDVIAFLGILNRDVQEIQDEGGLERVMIREGISRIWANRVDYEGLTAMLKTEEEEKEEEPPEEAEPIAADTPLDLPAETEDARAIEVLLAMVERETDPSRYRDHVAALARTLLAAETDRRLVYAARALEVLAAHVESPPGESGEIAEHARAGILDIATEDLVACAVGRIRDRNGRGRQEAEAILVTVGERAVAPLLTALSEEEDLFARKAIMAVIIRIGRPAVPAILDGLNDHRWYIVRNMITILGSLGLPDLAPHIAGILENPDLRVKKEAIKALAKLPHPSSIATLGRLCFFPEETVALTATTALSSKREDEAVLVLYRRAVHKRIFYPRYRLSHEAIDALRAIGTDAAVTALENILRAKAVWETRRFRAMKVHALRSLSRVGGEKPLEILRNVCSAPERYLRWEAERLLKRITT